MARTSFATIATILQEAGLETVETTHSGYQDGPALFVRDPQSGRSRMVEMAMTEMTTTTCGKPGCSIERAHQHEADLVLRRRERRESACRHCRHASARHNDNGCDGCFNRGRDCVGYDPS